VCNHLPERSCCPVAVVGGSDRLIEQQSTVVVNLFFATRVRDRKTVFRPKNGREMRHFQKNRRRHSAQAY
jgi:hypothetical protein